MSAGTLIKKAGPLLLKDGSLEQVGWSSQPKLDCNLEFARPTPFNLFQSFRLKRWDYYALFTPEYFFSFTLADLGYAGSVFAYAIHWQTGECVEATLTLPLGKGVILPRNSTEGDAHFKNKQLEMDFLTRAGERQVKMIWKEFGGVGKPDFMTNVSFASPAEHESLNLAFPIGGKKFYFNRKINCMPANGIVHYGGKEYIVTPDSCLGSLDWGRGVWAYASHWVWASSSGFLPNGRTIGLNLGYGFSLPGSITEHAIILDGKIYKFDQVDFQFDSQHYTAPWRMTSPDGCLALTFTPSMERVARTDLKLVYTEVHQMFGIYSGNFTTPQGEVIHIEGLKGFAEEHYARW